VPTLVSTKHFCRTLRYAFDAITVDLHQLQAIQVQHSVSQLHVKLTTTQYPWVRPKGPTIQI